MYYSLLAGAGNVGRYSVFTVHDHGEGLTIVGLLKRWLAAYQHEEDDAKAPDICGTRDKIRITCTVYQQIRGRHANGATVDMTKPWIVELQTIRVYHWDVRKLGLQRLFGIIDYVDNINSPMRNMKR